MKRRDFLLSATSFVLPLTVNGLGFKTFTRDSPLVMSTMQNFAVLDDRILVMIYLNGGNDGLNTVIPLEYYSQYNSIRNNIAIPESQVLKLAGNAATGLHPAMTGMRDLYNQGKLAIVHSVSYPNPDLSHFRATDIWMSGVDSNQYTETGWTGRYLADRFAGYPSGYPNSTMPDPLAIQIGNVNTKTLAGLTQPMNISLQNPDSFYRLLGNFDSNSLNDLPCCEGGRNIDFVRQQQILSVGYSSEIKRAADAGTNMGIYPALGTNNLAEQLKIVARLIHGGMKSKIYFVELMGFDTHALQVDTNDVTAGTHASLLKQLSDAVSAFQNDLKLQGTEDKVIGMTFSDFGRRANSNASRGTDHGVAAPMFVFGTGIKRQVVGTNPDLINDLVPPLAQSYNNNQDIKMQIDFRRIYRDILSDWFGTPVTKTDALLFRSFETTSLFSTIVESVKSGNWPDRSVWSSGRVPAATDYVRINSGHIVGLGQNVTVRNIQVDGGAELKVLGNYVINTTG